MINKRSSIIVAIVIVVIGLGLGATAWQKTRSDLALSTIKNRTSNSDKVQSYQLKLESGVTYPVGSPKDLRFTIRDKNQQVFKNFDTSQPYPLALAVIRTDRTNFQYIFPKYDRQTGTFTVAGFQLPAEGTYRIFANFTSNMADQEGKNTMSAPYVDVAAGNSSTNPGTEISTEKLASQANGYNMSLFLSSDDSPGQPKASFYAGSISSIAMSIDKNGQSVTNLKDYRGSLGRMIAFGPNLEFVALNADISGADNQAGLVLFEPTFPKSGQYIVFVQTEVGEQISTFDFVLNVKDNPKQAKTSRINR